MKGSDRSGPRARGLVLGALAGLLVLAAASGPAAGQEQLVSQLLTDAIYRGDGVIDLLKDVSGEALQDYIGDGGGRLLLGVDVNEDNSGNENSDSLGVAIRDVQLAISTSGGDFTFGEFFTSTTAMLRESGSDTASEFYTLFGQSGSSQITGGSGFNLATFDDVLWIDNIALGDVTIYSAELRVTFLDTPSAQATEDEDFFDFSGGFEDFAILSSGDATALEDASIGTAAAPEGVTYQEEESVTEVLLETQGNGDLVSPPGAPAPPAWMFSIIVLLLLVRAGHLSRQDA